MASLLKTVGASAIAHPSRDDGREEIDQGPVVGPLVGASASHQELLEEDLGADPGALLDVGHFGLRLRRALRGRHQREERTGDGDHDRRRHQQLDEREARLPRARPS
jgi:hypothetical protein